MTETVSGSECSGRHPEYLKWVEKKKGVRPAPNDSLLLNWSTRLAGPNGGQQESLPGGDLRTLLAAFVSNEDMRRRREHMSNIV